MGELGIWLPSSPKEKKRKTYFHHFKELFRPGITNTQHTHAHLYTSTSASCCLVVRHLDVGVEVWGKSRSGHGACWGLGGFVGCNIRHSLRPQAIHAHCLHMLHTTRCKLQKPFSKNNHTVNIKLFI